MYLLKFFLMWWIQGLPSHGEMDLTRFLDTIPLQELEGGVR